MSIEERVGRALHHLAERIEPGEGSWEHVQRRVDEARRSRRRGWATGATGAVAAAVLLVLALASLGSDGQLVETAPAAPSQSTTPPALPPPPDGPPPTSDRGTPTVVPGVWPLHTAADLEAYRDSGSTRYEDPVEVVRSFAVEYLAMVDPVVGERADGDAGTVEVVVRPRGESGQPLPPGVMDTVVVLYPFGGDPRSPTGPWNVASTTSSNIRLDRDRFPNGAAPITASGEATAYEGTVQVEVREAGMEAGQALGRDFVTAGTLGNFGRFATELAFDPPSTEGFGALVLYTESADGSTLEATVVSLNLGPGPIGPTEAEQDSTMIPGQTDVTVFFHRGEDELVPVTRSVPTTPGVLRASLEALIAGPTPEEQDRDLFSWFSEETTGMLNAVTLGSDGAAVVDLGDLHPIIPNASTSAGSDLLMSQFNATVFQFPTVTSVEYRINGSCDDFFEWLQRVCSVIERPDG